MVLEKVWEEVSGVAGVGEVMIPFEDEVGADDGG